MRRFAALAAIALLAPALAYSQAPAPAPAAPTVGDLLTSYTATAALKANADAAAKAADAAADAAAGAFVAEVTRRRFVVDARAAAPVIYYLGPDGALASFTAGTLADPAATALAPVVSPPVIPPPPIPLIPGDPGTPPAAPTVRSRARLGADGLPPMVRTGR